MATTLKQQMEAQGYVTVAKAAELASCSVYSVYRWLKKEVLEGEQIMGHWFISVRSLLDKKVGENHPNRAQLLAMISDTEEPQHAMENAQPLGSS